MGARTYAINERQKEDFYTTDTQCVKELLQVVDLSENILEPSVGMGHIAKTLTAEGHRVIAIDIVDRGYPNVKLMDFMEYNEQFHGDVVMNPPFKYAKEHILHALDLIPKGHKICAFLKIQFLESQGRKELFDKCPPKEVYIYRKRVQCPKDGDYEKYKSSAMMFCWFIFEKGYKGDPIIKWIDRK